METEIRCLIQELYDRCYNGFLEIRLLKPIGYQVEFGFNNKDKTITIAAELPHKKFLKFLREELRIRHWQYDDRMIGYRDFSYDK